MEPTVFKFVLRHSFKEQLYLVLFTLCAFPVLYFSLDLPKIIINEAISGTDFPKQLLDHDLEQVPYLMVLSFSFLFLVLINGALKYFINVYRGVVGERMLRRLRYLIFQRVLRFPLPQFRKLSQGEMVSMITAETEDIGGYIGDSIALPAFQGGTLLTILVFMFIQDAVLGTAAIVLYPVQAWMIPKLQRRLNLLRKERVLKVRRLSERIGEVVTGIRDVHANDTSQFELADYSEHLGGIYETRFNIYKQKFLIKFINNFIAQITPFFFYAIGGYLVINGELSFGALVAVLAAYKDLSAPWKELLDYYQTKEDARIKYELLLETFEPSGLLPDRLQSSDAPSDVVLSGRMRAQNLDLGGAEEDDSSGNVVNFTLELPAHVAVVGPEGSGKHRLADVIAGISRPRRGQLMVNDVDLVSAPESLTGRRVSYVSQQPSLRNATVRDNVLYVLKHRPNPSPQAEGESHGARESRLSGNSLHDIRDDWLDYQGVGVADAAALDERLIEILRLVELEEDIFELGLGQRIDPSLDVGFSEGILDARRALSRRLGEREFVALVEPFDAAHYNTNMSVVENLVFGAPRDRGFEYDRIANNKEVRELLAGFALEHDFVGIGRKVAELMVDLFADVEPGSPLFEQYSFISGDDLPMFRGLLSRTEGVSPPSIGDEDATALLSLSLKLNVARHRLGLIDESIQTRLVEARQVMRQRFAIEQKKVEPFDVNHVNSAVSVQDNVLFGRLVHGRVRSASEVGALIREMVNALGLRSQVLQHGLDFQVGIGGSRLSAAKRQKLALVRAMLKRPDILVLDGPTASFDERTQAQLLSNIRSEFQGRSLFWVMNDPSMASGFDAVVEMSDGQVLNVGAPAKPGQPDTELVPARA